MNPGAGIFIAGYRGLVGSALVCNLQEKGFTNLLTRTHVEMDLTTQTAIASYVAQEKPDYVFLAVVNVGSILANNTYPAEFIRDNLVIQNNIIHAAHKNNVKRLMFRGSSCIYPKTAPQPMKDAGPQEPTNRRNALTKIAGIKVCWSYNRQYRTKYLAVMPTSLYGPGNSRHSENSHVIPAPIRKFYEARQKDAKQVVVWDISTQRREFLYSVDMTDVCVFLMNLSDAKYDSLIGSDESKTGKFEMPLVNIGIDEDGLTKELVETVKQLVSGTMRSSSIQPSRMVCRGS